MYEEHVPYIRILKTLICRSVGMERLHNDMREKREERSSSLLVWNEERPRRISLPCVEFHIKHTHVPFLQLLKITLFLSSSYNRQIRVFHFDVMTRSLSKKKIFFLYSPHLTESLFFEWRAVCVVDFFNVQEDSVYCTFGGIDWIDVCVCVI